MLIKIHEYLTKNLWIAHLMMFGALIVLVSFSHWINTPAKADEKILITQCPDSQPYGGLTELPQTTILCKHGFSIGYSNLAKIPYWVSYELDPKKALGCEARSQFHDDMTLNYRFQSHKRDYSGSGFDIGHNVNAADMAYSDASSKDSFLMSNMSPQLPGFNRGIWKKLETQVRDWAWKDSFTIYAGNIYTDKSDTIGPDRVVIPDAMWKIIINNTTHEYIVFNIPHVENQKSLNEYIVTLQDLSNQTGITFPIPEDAKEVMKLWPTSKGRADAKKILCAK